LSLFVLSVLLAPTNLAAQSFGYVDSRQILEKMNTYQQAQQQINQIAEGWEKEVTAQKQNIEKLYKQFQAEQVLLTDKDRAKREQEIFDKEKALKDFQREKFGPEGELYKKRVELVKPIQDQVAKAIETVAKNKKIDFVLDKGQGVAIVYANPSFDYTADVLKELNTK